MKQIQVWSLRNFHQISIANAFNLSERSDARLECTFGQLTMRNLAYHAHTCEYLPATRSKHPSFGCWDQAVDIPIPSRQSAPCHENPGTRISNSQTNRSQTSQYQTGPSVSSTQKRLNERRKNNYWTTEHLKHQELHKHGLQSTRRCQGFRAAVNNVRQIPTSINRSTKPKDLYPELQKFVSVEDNEQPHEPHIPGSHIPEQPQGRSNTDQLTARG